MWYVNRRIDCNNDISLSIGVLKMSVPNSESTRQCTGLGTWRPRLSPSCTSYQLYDSGQDGLTQCLSVFTCASGNNDIQHEYILCLPYRSVLSCWHSFVDSSVCIQYLCHKMDIKKICKKKCTFQRPIEVKIISLRKYLIWVLNITVRYVIVEFFILT